MNREEFIADGRFAYGGEVEVFSHCRRDLYVAVMRVGGVVDVAVIVIIIRRRSFIAGVGFLRWEGKAPESSANLVPMSSSG